MTWGVRRLQDVSEGVNGVRRCQEVSGVSEGVRGCKKILGCVRGYYQGCQRVSRGIGARLGVNLGVRGSQKDGRKCQGFQKVSGVSGGVKSVRTRRC